MRGLHDLADLLFGFDYFISYAHADGRRYAAELSRRLEALGFSVFLDERVYVAGDDLHSATRRRIRMSKKLVVVVRDHALASEWVGKEVEVALARGRVPIAIDINDTLARAPADNPLRQALRDKIFIAETLDDPDGEPGDEVIMKLARSFEATRQQTLRVRALASASIVFATVALLALWQYREARTNAIEFYTLCVQTRSQVTAGIAKLQNLGRQSEFGRLVAGIAEKVAALPDPKSLECGEDPR
ncbi:MAG: toll/interleukin-1 receptor domain-containing protein [Rhodocyclaceae bacterium]|nr:toll/interleukin-1 receptor domain-containing protein [Rhodocyclaceae bacterium]MCP5241535.1 toll/interleukin-1 receptor domain-containing protein [Zoogloeaceae bacterium]MCP5295782.1 toll/interleukin-1 receptor domain-containing protein [Zoogloeaceae bacterium]MCW5616668.1 toll/interleukin-1 receptor domain-containing protein [Rhodocyclaceae bacterium]